MVPGPARCRREILSRKFRLDRHVPFVTRSQTIKVVAKVVPNIRAKTLQGFVEGRTKEAAHIYTDEGGGYVGKRLCYRDLIADNGLPSGARTT